MVKMTMGQENEVETFGVNLVVPRHGIVACMFGVQSRVESKPKRTDLTVGTICPDSTVGIKVSKFHELGGGTEESMGTSKRKGSMRTWTFFPCSSTP
jgi:hypothetical protein